MYTREVFNEQLSFPPYYLSKDHDGKIVIAGGGGASKTGITNQISFYGRNTNSWTCISSIKTGDFVVMNGDRHPVSNIFALGADHLLQCYSVSKRRIDLVKEVRSVHSARAEKTNCYGLQSVDLTPVGDEPCQKDVKFINPKLCITIGNDGFMKAWSFPDLRLIYENKCIRSDIEGEPISLELIKRQSEKRILIAAVTKKMVKLLKLTISSNQSKFKLSRVQTLYPPFSFMFKSVVSMKENGQFIVSSFKPFEKSYLEIYEVKGKGKIELSLVRKKVLKWKRDHHTKLALSNDAALIGVASTEGKITILSAKNLEKLGDIHPHSFFISGLMIEQTRSGYDIISCGGDNLFSLTRIILDPSNKIISKFIFVLFIVIVTLGLYKVFRIG